MKNYLFFLAIALTSCSKPQDLKVGDCIQSKQFEGLSSKYVPTYKILEVGTRLVIYQMCGNNGKTPPVEIERKEQVQSDCNVVACTDTCLVED